jgi:hypothetical protein
LLLRKIIFDIFPKLIALIFSYFLGAIYLPNCDYLDTETG